MIKPLKWGFFMLYCQILAMHYDILERFKGFRYLISILNKNPLQGLKMSQII